MSQVATGTGAAHPFTIPLTKIDVERRLVIGTAAEEIADKSREIMDYVSARPQFEEWSNSFSTATGGLSKGNLRVMHTKTVAGRLDAIDYDDVSKKVQIVAKVSDDNEWKKCLDGAYTGFSIGGGYLRKWKDPDTGLTRYTPIVREISLVDNPCMPTATFAELVKADGVVEQLPLHGVLRGFAESWQQRPIGFGEAWSRGPQEPAGPLTFGQLRKKAGGHSLSEAEHQQRIAAAKARWAHEGGGSLDELQAHYDDQMEQAKTAFFGRARKVRRLQESHDRFWSGVADGHEAYDKALPHLPKDAHGLIIMGQHVFHDPTETHKILYHNDFDPKHDHVYGIEPHEVDEQIEHWKRDPDYEGPRHPDDVHQNILENRERTAKMHVAHSYAMHAKGAFSTKAASDLIWSTNQRYGTSFSEHPHDHAHVERSRSQANDGPDMGKLAKRKVPRRGKGQAVGLARDWSEAKHPRGQNGKFTSGTGKSLTSVQPSKKHLFDPGKLSAKDELKEPAKQEEWDREWGRENRINVPSATLEGAAGLSFLATRGPDNVKNLVRMARFGVGDQGERNLTAYKLRGDRLMRSDMVRSARRAGEERLTDAVEIDASAANKARRKVHEEAVARGSSTAQAAKEAEHFASILNRRKGTGQVPVWFKDGVPGRRAPARAAADASRAVKQSLRGDVIVAKHIFNKPAGISPGAWKANLVRDLVLRSVGGIAGGVLGAQSAYRLQREEEGDGITRAHHVGATGGDVFRALNGAALAQLAGGVAGVGTSLYRQGFRLGSPESMAAGLGRININRMSRAGTYAGLAAAGLRIASNLPPLVREYGARAVGERSSASSGAKES